jgi:hypothetical protein
VPKDYKHNCPCPHHPFECFGHPTSCPCAKPNTMGWVCAGCGVPSPEQERSCACPTNVVLRGPIERREQAWKREPGVAKLSNTIRTRILGVRPEDQDVVLEDADWQTILTALS